MPSADTKTLQRLCEALPGVAAPLKERNLSTFLRRDAELFTESPAVSTRVG
jgi:hypothetical protein